MTTTKNPVSRKSGTIALSCALLAMTLLSGCCNENSYRGMAEECSKKGGTFCYTCEASSPFAVSISVSCKVVDHSESGAKK